MHGLNQGRPGIIDLISLLSPDIIMIQEHWLTPDNLYKLDDLSDNYFVFGSSAMNDRVLSGPLIGRPFGGTAMIIKKNLASVSENIISSDRYTVVKIANWLLFNVYMPCVGTDYREYLYVEILSEFDSMLAAHPNCSCLVGGDFNTCLDNPVNESVAINTFIVNNMLHRCDVLIPVSNKFTFFNESTNSGSAIDYMLASNPNDIIAFNVLDMDINLSDHYPIMVVCACPKLPIDQNSCQINQAEIHHFRWDHADLDKYYEHTRLLLQPVYDDLNALAGHYRNLDVKIVADKIDSIYNSFVSVLRISAEIFIPKHRKNFYKFWWTQELDDLKEKSIASCRKWKEAGKPRNGPIQVQYKKDKLLYKKCIKEEKAAETCSFTNDLHEALLNKSNQDFWKTWRSKFPNNSNNIIQVDGTADGSIIANNFASFLNLPANHLATAAMLS